ncbi:hypothetical protein B0H13DRAFT_2427629 [Mycena leptocephala]|nr:hypothetical protein B0H13DRAFT_2427629 [Mycena leptocephala]
MSTPVNPPLVLSDRPLNKKLIGELQSIAVFMKLDATLKKDALLPAIQRHIKENPELADNSHLLPLFAHRSSPKNDVKTSAAKAAEEEVEGKKPQPAATGANKILLAHNAKTDPPRPLRSFRREGINTSLPSPSMKTVSVLSYILHRLTSVSFLGSDSSIAGDPVPHDIVGTPELEIKGEMVNNHQGIKGIIHVNFYDELDHKKTLRQVIVDDFPVQLSTTVNGSKKYSALLSKLIPAVIKNDSPIKERNGRLYWPNIRDDPQHHHLGKIDALLDGSASALKVNAMNEYTLRTSDEGTFECDIFWDQLTGGAIAGQTNSHGGHAENPVGDIRDGPKVFSGAGSDIPLDIANDRAAHDPMHPNASAAQRQRFAQFIHGKVKEAVPDIPDFGEEWARCNFAGQMLDRHLAQEAVMKFMEDQKWSLTHGGFRVPRGSSEYPGIKFKKEFFLEKALNLKTSSTADIDKYFTPEMLQNDPDALAWVESGGKTNDSSFRKMKSARFKEHIQEDHRNHRRSDKGSSR